MRYYTWVFTYSAILNVHSRYCKYNIVLFSPLNLFDNLTSYFAGYMMHQSQSIIIIIISNILDQVICHTDNPMQYKHTCKYNMLMYLLLLVQCKPRFGLNETLWALVNYSLIQTPSVIANSNKLFALVGWNMHFSDRVKHTLLSVFMWE